ncbi:MAG TPA: FkbM family methyltransferase [Puia sp.]|jgi:FkbM family methyltransferase|nr:FkbM family methyltransferase [Puia sp.]
MTEDTIRKLIREEIRANNDILEEKIKHHQNLLPFATYMGEDTVLTKSYFYTMYLVSAHDTIVAPYLIRYGVYETELTKYLLNAIRPDSVFVDVGANIGYYTCMASKKISAGQVFAFEPNEKAFRLLQRNIMLNWPDCPVKAEQVAISDKKDEVAFKNYKYKFVTSQFFTSEEEGEMNSYEVVKVPTISLDEYFPQGQKIDFLKIDVEGAELGVLKGAKRVIETNPGMQILMEWSVPQLKTQGTDPHDIIDFFMERGYTPSQLDWRDGSASEVNYDHLRQTEYMCAVLLQKK